MTQQLAREMDQLHFTMFTNAEAFYYGAHRIQKLLKSRRLPHVVGFEEVKKVTYVRDLIEHSFGRAYTHAVASRLMVHPVHGPTMSARSVTEPDAPDHPMRAYDGGLFVVVAEFKAKVMAVLTRALDAMGGPIDQQKMLQALGENRATARSAEAAKQASGSSGAPRRRPAPPRRRSR